MAMQVRHRSPPSLVNLCLKQITDSIMLLTPDNLVCDCENHMLKYFFRKINISVQSIEEVAQYYSCLPTPLFNELAKHILASLVYFLQNWQRGTNAARQMEIKQGDNEPQFEQFVILSRMVLKRVSRLVLIVLQRQLQNLDTLCEFPMDLCEVVLNNMSKLSGLRHLCLDFTHLPGFKVPTKALAQSIRGFPKLVSFILPRHATDAILAAISLHCPLIEEIYVAMSEVTDEGVKHLLQCRKLRMLNVTKTKVTADGLAEVLVALPIQDIGDYGPFQPLLEAIENNAPDGELALRNIWLLRCEMKQCNYAKMFCLFPKVDTFEARIEQKDLDIIVGFEKLKVLDLKCDCAEIGLFAPFLELRGANLVHITLVAVSSSMYFMDACILVAIGRFCPQIRVLELQADAMTEWPGVEFQVPPEVAPFQQLERLWLAGCAWEHIYLVMMLRFAVNIRVVRLDVPQIEHDSIEKILDLNPMDQLEELNVQGSLYLEQQTLYLLMKKCRKLKVISGLATWRSLEKKQFRKFMKFVAANNCDLKVFCEKMKDAMQFLKRSKQVCEECGSRVKYDYFRL